jgi:hypothetical protein
MKIALASFVRDEEKTIESMILSCKGLVDFVALVDTGSVDRTKEKALSAIETLGVPYTLQDLEFTTFGHARTFAAQLPPAEYPWVLMLDGDETISACDFDKFRALVAQHHDAWVIPRYAWADAEMTKLADYIPYPDGQGRLFRNYPDKSIHYFNPIHELLNGYKDLGWAPHDTVPTDRTGGPHINHMKYCLKTHEEIHKIEQQYQRFYAGGAGPKDH